jgi:hypothetical protein
MSMAVPTCGQVAIDEKLQILVREQQSLQEKRAAGLTNETFHPWMNEWLSHEEMVKEKAWQLDWEIAITHQAAATDRDEASSQSPTENARQRAVKKEFPQNLGMGRTSAPKGG